MPLKETLSTALSGAGSAASTLASLPKAVHDAACPFAAPFLTSHGLRAAEDGTVHTASCSSSRESILITLNRSKAWLIGAAVPSASRIAGAVAAML